MKERDLFGDLQGLDKKGRGKKKFIFPYAKKNITISYENIILLAIGVLMSCIICFSLGVEKGRRDWKNITKTRDIISRTPIKNLQESSRRSRSVSQGEYIVQLAAYKNRAVAEQELKTLQQEGYPAEIKKSGVYYQLYIGGFTTAREAQRLVNLMRNKYRDCYYKKI